MLKVKSSNGISKVYMSGKREDIAVDCALAIAQICEEIKAKNIPVEDLIDHIAELAKEAAKMKKVEDIRCKR